MASDEKIIVTGGAGLVGQNLVISLRKEGYSKIIVLDKNLHNLKILQQLHPDVIALHADLSKEGTWAEQFEGADIVVMLQAQIGGKFLEPFIDNNITATSHILAAMKKYHVPYVVHISSSVVNSVADDYYTRTKKEQEKLVQGSGIDYVILRPTLMFGWFDRKHLGWLSRLMKKCPVFPIPGHGKYMRQPLYVGDFCRVIMRCITMRITGKVFDITGFERIDYIDIIRQIKKTIGAKTWIVNIPYRVFYGLLKLWAMFDKNPPFTAAQLKALVAPDEFEVIDWPHIFTIQHTPFAQALDQTFNDQTYSNIVVEF